MSDEQNSEDLASALSAAIKYVVPYTQCEILVEAAGRWLEDRIAAALERQGIAKPKGSIKKRNRRTK
jgi:hypothetical protein